MKSRLIKLTCCLLIAVVCAVVIPSPTMGKEGSIPPEHLAKARGYFISAKRFEIQGDYRGAIVELLEAAALDPQSPTIPYTIARNYLSLGNAERAIEYTRKAVTLDPTFTEGRRFLISLFRHSGDSAGAISQLERVIEEQPDDWEAFFTLVTLYSDRGEHGHAAKLLNNLKKRKGLPPQIAVNAASFLLDMKRYKEAGSFYRMAVDNDSTVKEAWLGLGTLVEASGDTQKAIDLYQEALKKNPKRLQSDDDLYSRSASIYDLYGRLASLYLSKGLLDEVLKSGTESSDFYYSLGMALIRSEHYNDAAKVMTYAMSRSDTIDAELWRNAAYAYLQAGRYDEGIELLINNAGELGGEDATLSMMKFGLAHVQDRERITKLVDEALSRDPENDLLLDTQGTLLTAGERWAEAVPVFEKAAAILPKNTDYLFDLGNALERSGRFDEAVTVFEKLLAIDPEHSYALNYLGYMFAEKGIRLEEAVEMLKKAVADRPDNGAFLDSLGWAYYRLGAFDKAEGYIDQAVQRIDPQDKENAVIFEHLGDVAKSLGKIEKARMQWMKSLEIDPHNVTAREKLNSLTTK